METARKYNSGKVRFNLAAIRNSREIKNRATVTTSEIITVIGIGQAPFHLLKVYQNRKNITNVRFGGVSFWK